MDMTNGIYTNVCMRSDIIIIYICVMRICIYIILSESQDDRRDLLHAASFFVCIFCVCVMRAYARICVIIREPSAGNRLTVCPGSAAATFPESRTRHVLASEPPAQG